MSTPTNPSPGALTTDCVTALRNLASLIESAHRSDTLACLDWLTIRRHAAEVITWAAEEDGMMDGMMGGPEVLRALAVKGDGG